MTKEQIETLQEGSIIECGYGLMMVSYFEDVERETMKEKESDSDYIRLVRVESVYEDDGEYVVIEDGSDVYNIDDFLNNDFRLVK